ncbi:MAG: helix-turn-helix transcriptional regulator [Clostridiales bacterium]|nr:helix-turn-helix transcriptional regulator [Clostridiales bacterium]
MINKKIGKRIKQCREQLNLTQQELAEQLGMTTNYISSLERGASFPRCENLVTLLNGLDVPADAIFCDVVNRSSRYMEVILSEELRTLSPEAQKRILQTLAFMIRQEKHHEVTHEH